MNMDEIFRHFFGFNSRHPFDGFSRNDPDDEFPNADGDPFHHQHPDPFVSPLGIMRHFEEMFRNFGLADFPSIGVEITQLEPPTRDELTPRQEMLKEREDSAPNFSRPWHKGILEKPDGGKFSREDSDLDGKISDGGGLGALMPAPKAMIPSTYGYFSSVAIRTVKGSDGKLEEHRTVRDSNGKEETTVLRVIGNESHSVTTLSDSDGFKEKLEDFFNLDEGQLNDFNRKWIGQKLVQPSETMKQPTPHDDSYTGIFKKLFGFSPSGREN